MKVQHAERAVVPSRASEPIDIEIAEVYPEGPRDTMIRAGWYWRTAPGPGEPTEESTLRLMAWREAVRNGQGPHRNGREAIKGAETWSPAVRIAVTRLHQAAELVHGGAIAPDAESVSAEVERLIRDSPAEQVEPEPDRSPGPAAAAVD